MSDVNGMLGQVGALAAMPQANGHMPDGAAVPSVEETILSETESLPRLDAVRGVFIASNGEEIELSDRPVSSLIVERLTLEGKPKIPMVEVTVLGKHRHLEPNPNHEGYKAQLAEWEAESRIRILKYLYTVGVKGSPDEEFRDIHLTFFPDATDMDLKYLWVCSRVPDGEVEALTDAIVGRTLPTTKGVDEAANSFRRSG